MSASDDPIGKKIEALKNLASRRVDEILKTKNAKAQNDNVHLIKSFLSWFSNNKT